MEFNKVGRINLVDHPFPTGTNFSGNFRNLFAIGQLLFCSLVIT